MIETIQTIRYDNAPSHTILIINDSGNNFPQIPPLLQSGIVSINRTDTGSMSAHVTFLKMPLGNVRGDSKSDAVSVKSLPDWIKNK